MDINQMQNIKIYKNVQGSLLIDFEDVTTSGNKRTVRIGANEPFIRLPLKFVASIFTIYETKSLYSKGFFYFEDKDKELIFAYGKELDLYFDGEDGSLTTATVYKEAEIKNALRTGKLKIIDDIIDNGSQVQKQNLITVAVEMVDTLSVGTVNHIEEKLGVGISVGDM